LTFNSLLNAKSAACASERVFEIGRIFHETTSYKNLVASFVCTNNKMCTKNYVSPIATH